MPGEKNSISVVAFQLLYMTVEALLLGSPPYYTNTVKNLAKIISLENMYCKCECDDCSFFRSKKIGAKNLFPQKTVGSFTINGFQVLAQ